MLLSPLPVRPRLGALAEQPLEAWGWPQRPDTGRGRDATEKWAGGRGRVSLQRLLKKLVGVRSEHKRARLRRV